MDKIKVTNSKIPKPKLKLAILNADIDFNDELIISTIYDLTSDISSKKEDIEILARILKTKDESQTVLCEPPFTNLIQFLFT